MNTKDVIRHGLDQARKLTEMLLSDLEDVDLFVRPVPTANHIAWQMGHLIVSENTMMEMVRPGLMPPLPDGFADGHNHQSADVNDPGQFLRKNGYMELAKRQRNGTLALLDGLAEDELDTPTPDPLSRLAFTYGEVFVLIGAHETMHAGQFSTVRRKIGKPHVF